MRYIFAFQESLGTRLILDRIFIHLSQIESKNNHFHYHSLLPILEGIEQTVYNAAVVDLKLLL